MSSSSSKKPSAQAQIDALLERLSAQDKRITVLETIPSAPAEKKPRKKRAPKNPDAPTRAPSSWIVFLGKKREEAKTAHPDAKMTELTTIISKMWAALTPEQKAEYKPEPGAVAAPKPPKTPKAPKTPKEPKEKKPKDPDAPKKPIQGYLLFQQQERAKLTPPEKVSPKVLSERWALLSAEEKAAYKSS